MVDETTKKNRYSVLNCEAMEGVLSLIDALQSTPQGRIIYQQVEHALRDLTVNQNKISYGYAAILNVILESYRQHLPKSSLLYLELKLVQKRLMPPITLNELAVLHAYIKKVSKLTGAMLEPDEAILREALMPLLGPNEIEVEDEKPRAAEAPQASSPSLQDDVIPISQPNVEQPEQQPVITETQTTPSVELRVDSLFRQRLNKHYAQIQELQSILSNKIKTTTEQYQDFGEVLENALFQLEKSTDGRSLEEVRRNISRQVRTLLTGQSTLAHMLADTQSYLSLIGDNSQKLSEELDQVRVLSLTDDLTGLPNRRAFLRRAEDEIGRAERDKTPLALVAIDLDYFKSINDQYGHSVGDEILKIYASDVLSIFRRYDMVSRYGGEEFAVLLPNTDKAGALRALNKIRSKVANTHYLHAGQSILIPAFSAGLVIHRPGEPLQKLIERADRILYKAKQLGRNRIEIDESYLGPNIKIDTATENLV